LAVSDGIDRLEEMTGGKRVIHGSPHRLNILTVNHTATFIDFETVEFGPLEWDLAHLEPELSGPARPGSPGPVSRVGQRGNFDVVLGRIGTRLDMLRHAQHHLELVRSARH
jgi:hypothetical protein